jgi:hypothetical protein
LGSFIGVYYPHSRPLSDETLKRAVLVFDEIVFVDPRTPRVYDGKFDEAAHQPHLPFDAARLQRLDWEESAATLEPLIQAGVARYVDPTPLLDDDLLQQAMTDSLQADMGSTDTFELFKASPPAWSILRSRIPRGAFPFLHHQYTPRVLYAENTGRPIDSSFGFHALFADGKPDQEYGMPPYPGATPEVDAEYACVLPYYLGSSLSVSLAVAGCQLVQGFPFTDSLPHRSLLRQRLDRFVGPGLEGELTHAETRHDLSLLDAAISAETLSALSIEQVLEIRARVEEARVAVVTPLRRLLEPASPGTDTPDTSIGIANAAGLAAAQQVLDSVAEITSVSTESSDQRVRSCEVIDVAGSRIGDALAAPAAADGQGAAPRSDGLRAMSFWFAPSEREFDPDHELQLPAQRVRLAVEDGRPTVAAPESSPYVDAVARRAAERRRWWNFWKRSR